MCSDHLQPGSQVALTSDISPKLMNSIFTFGGVRTSSGVLKLFFCDADMMFSLFLAWLLFRVIDFDEHAVAHHTYRSASWLPSGGDDAAAASATVSRRTKEV